MTPRAKAWSRKEAGLGDFLDLVLWSLIDGIRKLGSNKKIGITVNKRIDAEKKKDADKSGIGIKITKIVHSLFIAGNKILNCQLSKTVLNAVVMIGMIGQINDFRTLIDVLLDRSEGECRSMID
jgi:hypothetical protein